jgi:hypothetical protein
MFTHAKCALQNVLYTKKLFTHGERALKNGFSHAEQKNLFEYYQNILRMLSVQPF